MPRLMMPRLIMEVRRVLPQNHVYLESSIFWLRAAVLLYSIGLIQVLLTVLRGKQEAYRFSLFAFFIGTVLHLVSLTEMAIYRQSIPVTNFYETSSACGFLNAVAFLFVQWKYDFKGLQMFLFPLVFLLSLIGATELPIGPWVSQSWDGGEVRGALLKTHIVLVLFGYAAMFLMAVTSLFYLIQERNLKQKTRSALFERLPSLSALDTVVSNSMGWGFLFLTLSVLAGVIWGFIELGTAWIAHPEVAISLITWLLYLVMVFLRTSAGWRGRRAAWMSLTVLGCSALTWMTHFGMRSLAR
jgi:ABC-type uncharacterized transport system permease subunit